MIFNTTALEGPVIIDLETHDDHRGFFARTFCADEFREAGLEPTVDQCNLSFNHRAGTLRGMHFQVSPHPEAKLVRCIRGAIIDVIVDMRVESPTRLQHVAVELSARNRRSLYVPPFFAHAYQTLVDGTEVLYQVSGAYARLAERGVRYDDAALGITWPLAVSEISEKDAGWPLIADTDPEWYAGVREGATL